MSLKSRFLTLPMKEQIKLVIIFLTIYSLLSILLLTCSFCYEILQEDSKRKKYYFYDRYKDYIESCFYYHNFILLQYEELIKRMQNQIFKYHKKALFFNYTFNFNNDFTQYKVSMFDPNDYMINSNSEIYQDEEKLFYYCYFPNSTLCNFLGEFARAKYNSLSSIIFATDLYKYFRIPGYEVSLIDDPILVNVNRSTIFSFNASNIFDNLDELLGGYSDSKQTQLYYYYQKKVGYMMNDIYVIFLYYYANVLFCFNHIFEHTLNEIFDLDEVSIIKRKDMSTLYEFAKIICGYYTIVNFPENKFRLISYANNQYYYIEGNLITNYLYYINNNCGNFLDVSIIALNYENNTLVSPELCILFLLKQHEYYIGKGKLEEYNKNIISGKSNITDCFMDPEAFWEQMEINDIFKLNNSYFFFVDNSISQGIVKTKNINYYYIKYSYPSYSVLKEFVSDYFLLNQVNFYLFAPFKDPIDYTNLVYQINSNCFKLIILLIVYIWGICLFVNLIIFCKVGFQLTEPIKKLQEAIESSSLKDENIFKYEYDEVINELFLTSRELLSGQIDMNNDEKGLEHFNILSKPKDKDKNLDNNLYKKNLIINNDIMNKLIMEQQNMMDFSKNIKTNEELDNFDDTKNKVFDKINNSQIIEDNLNLPPLYNKESSPNKNNVNQNEINEVKDKEPYKRLFKIAEYLMYYQNKNENNFVNIINNVITDDSKKSSISKISSNVNTTNPSKMKNFVRGNSYGKPDENENFSINMLDNRSMTYLWYMESKKRKNKSFNFQINENYDELFKDYNYYQNNYENSINKGNINIESNNKNI